MARILRFFGVGLVKCVSPTLLAASLALGGIAHFSSLEHEKTVREIISKPVQLSYSEQESKKLKEQEYQLQNCENSLGIAAYGALASPLIAAAGGALWLADEYRRKRAARFK